MTTAFVRAANPIWFMVDLVGEPLNDEYYAFFLTNTLPYTFQPVYEDLNGTTPWANPLQFYPNGTLPDNLYFNDSLVYRIEIRHGNSQSDPLIYEINNYIPSDAGGGADAANSTTTDNQISNSQFSQVNFVSPLSITAAGTYAIAPGWSFVLTGAGTATVTQIALPAANDQINNAPYVLRIATSGFDTAYLAQRFNNNGALWSSVTDQQDGVVSMSVTAVSNGLDYNVTLLYVPSNTSYIYPVVAQNIITSGDYQVLDGSITLLVSDNNQTSATAYIEMQIVLEGTGSIDISNVQCIGQTLPEGSATPDPIVYQQETIERQIDHLFHYYKDSIIFQPKKSILTAWNFSLNPYQFITSTVTDQVAQAAYCADQTILYQEGASRLQVGAAPVAYRGCLQINAKSAAVASKFAIIQYIDPATIKPYWGSKVSSLVKAALLTGNGSNINVKMRLISNPALPSPLTNVYPILSFTGTDPVFAAGWTEIKPENDPAYALTHTTSLNAFNEFPAVSYNKFQLPVATTSTQTLAIVFYCTTILNSTPSPSPDTVYIDKISLMPNDFAIDTEPQTFDEALRECQFYYEKSYNNEILPATATLAGSLNRVMLIDDNKCYPAPFEFEFNSIKRSSPAITFYSISTTGPGITLGYVTAQVHNLTPANISTNVLFSTYFSFLTNSESTKCANYITNSTLPMAIIGGSSALSFSNIRFHYTANALLGAPATGIP